MPYENQVILMGHLERYELKMSKAGNDWIQGTLYNQTGSGEHKNHNYIDFKAFGKQCEFFAQKNPQKRDLIMISGELVQEKWTTQEGEKRSRHVVVCRSFAGLKFLKKGEPRADVNMVGIDDVSDDNIPF